jgi:hypothetical protein
MLWLESDKQRSDMQIQACTKTGKQVCMVVFKEPAVDM